MPDALTIRPATLNDAQSIARIRVQGWRFAYQGPAGQSPCKVRATVKNGRLCSLHAAMRCWGFAVSARHRTMLTASKGLFRAGRWSEDSTHST